VEETEMGATLKVYPKLGVAAVGSTSFIVSPDRPGIRYFGTSGSESDLTANAGNLDRGFLRDPRPSGLPDRPRVS
jgi:hypothetical protein